MQSEKSFSLVPALLFQQALSIECAPFPVLDGEIQLLVFTRYAQVPAPDGCVQNREGLTAGVEVVAYPCDECGRVFSWERRYQTSAVDVVGAVRRLRYELANGELCINNHEGVAEVIEDIYREAATIDWAEMPEHLQ